MRHLLPVFAVLLGVSVSASALGADKAKRRLDHKVEQAILYVNMKLLDRAKEELTKLVQTDPGKSDALTWLALSKTHYALKDVDEAGLARPAWSLASAVLLTVGAALFQTDGHGGGPNLPTHSSGTSPLAWHENDSREKSCRPPVTRVRLASWHENDRGAAGRVA